MEINQIIKLLSGLFKVPVYRKLKINLREPQYICFKIKMIYLKIEELKKA